MNLMDSHLIGENNLFMFRASLHRSCESHLKNKVNDPFTN